MPRTRTKRIRDSVDLHGTPYESHHVEFKRDWSDDYLRWISAFANADGGVLRLGVDDEGIPVGLAKARKAMEDIPNKVRDILGILVEVESRPIQNKICLDVLVEAYPYPVSCKGRYYLRSGSTCQELKGAALDRFLLSRRGRHWDGVPVPNVGVTDLDSAALAEFRGRALKSQRLSSDILAEPDAGMLEKLHLREGAYLKRAALILFHSDPERFVTGAFVKIGFFRSDSDLAYHDEIHGDLFSQSRRTLDLLSTKYMKASISYEGLQRIETWPVPIDALRESVLNALIHKDYASGVPVQISVYDHKLMIWNPGVLPESWDIARLMGKHPSQPSNPDIANSFFRAGSIESWGRGIDRILEACRAVGNPAPQIQLEATGIWVVFPFKSDKGSGDLVSGGAGTREKTREKTRERILRLLREDPFLSTSGLAQELSITDKGVEWQLRALKADGRLRRQGADKGGHWEVVERE